MVIKVVANNRNSYIFGILASCLVLGGIIGNYYFAEQTILLRLPVLFTVIGFAGFLFIKTNPGHKFWNYWHDSLAELRKVVWPTKKETIQSTIGVLAMVLIMGIFLWSVDAVLVRIMAWLLSRHGGA